MLKYESTLITFTEVPDEISLCFNFRFFNLKESAAGIPLGEQS